MYFLSKLTTPAAYVLDQTNVESDNWPVQLNGTGPFKLTEFISGGRVVLERNDAYHRGSIELETVIISFAGDDPLAMYESDQIDIASVGPLESLLDPDAFGQDLLIGTGDLSVSYIGFNLDVPPFDDRKFRQALAHSVNKPLIADEELSGQVEPAFGIMPPGLPGHNPNLEGLRFDLDLARTLVSESKYADPTSRPTISLTVPGTGGEIGLDLRAVIASWQLLGVVVEVQRMGFGEFLQALQGNEHQAFSLSWTADYPDPHNFLDLIFHTDGGFNNTGYSNPKVDNILEEARVEQDPSRRFELYQNAESVIIDDAAWLPLWNTRGYSLVKPYVQGYELTPLITSVLKSVSIEP